MNYEDIIHHQIVHYGHMHYHYISLERELLINVDFKAAILDYENTKPLASSHPGSISSIPLELIQNAKNRLLPNIARFHACATELSRQVTIETHIIRPTLLLLTT